MSQAEYVEVAKQSELMTLIMLLWKDGIALRHNADLNAIYSVCGFQIKRFMDTRAILYPLNNDEVSNLSEMIMDLIHFCLFESDVAKVNSIFCSNLDVKIITQGLHWIKYLFKTDHLVF
jgi:hypothetical protein